MNVWSHAPLTPVGFLHRAVAAHADRVAIIDGQRTWTYQQMLDQTSRMAGVIKRLSGGKPVAILSPNTPGMLLAHFAIPWSATPMVPLNTRLSAGELAALVEHSGAGLLLYDSSLRDVVSALTARLPTPLQTCALDDADDRGINPVLLAEAPMPFIPPPETALLSINYTSGTTGRPKGVMYQHRGAYLQALAMVAHTQLTPAAVYLWTLPMFHCHGWCFPWAVTATGATHVCMPRIDQEAIWSALTTKGVTHLHGAPTVLSMIADAPGAVSLHRPVHVGTGGAPPSPALLRRMASLGFDITHLYGLTETYGPALICEWRPEWDAFADSDQAKLKSRQGVGNVISQPARVITPDGRDVPADASTVGEIALQGNNVMLGYYNDPDATAATITDGWLRTGDLGIIHPDGYIELRDRSKDVIISGGENITSVQIENVIAEHPAVAEVAVIGAPDQKWGEVPIAYITVRGHHTLQAEEVKELVRSRLARFKTPREVIIVDDLPKTSTGKIQKHLLRSARALYST